jgi:PTS system nitrogen regulatory IIA component
MLLTARDAASLLRTTERQLYRWVDDQEIPFQRIRDQVRFNRTELLEWASSRRLPVSLEAFDDGEEVGPSLAAALRRGGVHDGGAAADREAALRKVVATTTLPASVDAELLVEVLLAREATSSTAIGEGIAIPHVRHPVVAAGEPLATVTYLEPPVAFGAPDGQPVHTIFLLVTPTVLAHLQLLARLAHALQDPEFRAALGRHAGTEELAEVAARVEHAALGPPP